MVPDRPDSIDTMLLACLVLLPGSAALRPAPLRVVASRRALLRMATPESNDSEDSPQPYDGEGVAPARNVLGGTLHACCTNVGGTGIGTGFFRDGFCSTGFEDEGRHTVCTRVTADFLAFSQAAGNDLSTPMPQYAFPGLKPGDTWCLCAARWAQALAAGKAPEVFLLRTHEKTLQYAALAELRRFAIDADEADADLAELTRMREALERNLAEPGQ